MKSFFTAAAVAGVLAFAATTAQAAVYDLTGGNATQGSFTVNDLTITSGRAINPSGQGYNNAYVQDSGNVTRNTNGMGVRSAGDGSGEVDGYGNDDVLIFSFDSAVKLISAEFTNVDYDVFTLWFDDDGNGSLYGDRVGTGNPGDPFGGLYTFTSDYIGTLFGFGAESSNDYWRVASITANSISAVPVPAALPLFGAALLGMGFLARRRKQKAALQA
ncbi:MAG: VPLPA-CTERM sorting domain-containing protein [Sneathiella sp.]|uniref:VPLPA-CTERM sorting domain-containing protein n=1 Tax=Sneathiella sp. TaxID=1964365 RepID=UPI003001A3A2